MRNWITYRKGHSGGTFDVKEKEILGIKMLRYSKEPKTSKLTARLVKRGILEKSQER